MIKIVKKSETETTNSLDEETTPKELNISLAKDITNSIQNHAY